MCKKNAREKKNFFLTNFCHKSDIFKNYLWRKLKICVLGNSAKACTQKGAKKCTAQNPV